MLSEIYSVAKNMYEHGYVLKDCDLRMTMAASMVLQMELNNGTIHIDTPPLFEVLMQDNCTYIGVLMTPYGQLDILIDDRLGQLEWDIMPKIAREHNEKKTSKKRFEEPKGYVRCGYCNRRAGLQHDLCPSCGAPLPTPTEGNVKTEWFKQLVEWNTKG